MVKILVFSTWLLAVAVALTARPNLAHSKELYELSDAELSRLVGDVINSEISSETIGLWELRPPEGVADRLCLKHLPVEFLDEDALSREVFNDWCQGQVKLGTSSGNFYRQMHIAYTDLTKQEIAAVSDLVERICIDESLTRDSRIAAALLTTSADSEEVYDCMSLLLFTYCVYSDTCESDGARLIMQVSEKASGTIVYSLLANLLVYLEHGAQGHEGELRDRLALLRQHQFRVPMLIQDVEPTAVRRLSFSLKHPRGAVPVELSTTNFEVYEEFRKENNIFETVGRGRVEFLLLRIMEKLLVLISSYPEHGRRDFYESIADDLWLMDARILQLDNFDAQISAVSYMARCLEEAGAQRDTNSEQAVFLNRCLDVLCAASIRERIFGVAIINYRNVINEFRSLGSEVEKKSSNSVVK